ncbi:hypothetical protein LTR84_011099 [Exophiala bonariae]|uniref:Uncharacterized protein n=1 Tax=Exophiala bonariae TaxID=1690606 RepID=A0AAV9NI87_9EURO|nr:hypothetical protein LTR84_011099 [Exophiala bonariae]
MRSQLLYTYITLSTISGLANAWPVILGRHERREPASYSVVAVDGGGSGADGSATTVISSVVRTETVLQTQLSTIVITEAETPSTIIITITSASATTVTERPAATQTVTSPPETTAQPSQTASPETVTVTQSLPSSKPYDDGMWHTYYYYTPSEEARTVPTSTSEAINSLPSSTETIATSLEPTYTPSPTVDWASFWRVPPVESSSETISTSSVNAPTGSTAFWDGRPGFGSGRDTTS